MFYTAPIKGARDVMVTAINRSDCWSYETSWHSSDCVNKQPLLGMS